MIADVWAVMWKELKEFLLQSGTARGGLVRMLIFAAAFGVLLPLQAGRAWVTSPLSLLNAIWLPLLLVISVTVDSVAGERERHTLETLLASRLSDRSILLGKVAASVLYAWGLAIAGTLISLVTCNLALWQGELLLYSPEMSLSIVSLSLLVAALGASAGVLASLRAATVRQAAQTLTLGMLIVGSAIGFGITFGFEALPPESRKHLVRLLVEAGPLRVGLVAAGVLIVATAGLLAIALARFQRARLMLD